jgi:hypothetical protein
LSIRHPSQAESAELPLKLILTKPKKIKKASTIKHEYHKAEYHKPKV